MNGIRVSIYIVTYRNPVYLNRNISSILASGADAQIHVINNHSEFSLEPKFEKAVTVLHNRLRPDFSAGHLSRNWNQALVHGFKDLKNPASDIVVTVQDDVLFEGDWLSRLVALHRRYSFITQGSGDAFCSYLPDGVIKVGLWDERFCSIGWAEGDYFLRQLIYNRQCCSINDLGHDRQHNTLDKNSEYGAPNAANFRNVPADSLLITTPKMNPERKDAHISSMRFHGLGETIFRHKWGLDDCPWKAEHFEIREPLVPSYMMYPYFEADVEGLREKRYIVAEEDMNRRWANVAAKWRTHTQT